MTRANRKPPANWSPLYDTLVGCSLVADVLEHTVHLTLNENAVPDEFEFYEQRVGFSLAHMMTWCQQLDFAVAALANFRYSKESGLTRGRHLIYNIENYLIRLHSVYDRALHVVNAVYHLGVNEEAVSHTAIVTNYRVNHDSDVVKHLKALRKFLERYAQDRHTLIHRHSLLDKELTRLEVFYSAAFEYRARDPAWAAKAMYARSQLTRRMVADKKRKFSDINTALAQLICALLAALHPEYSRQRSAFQLRGFGASKPSDDSVK